MIRILEAKRVGRLFARRAARMGEAEAVVRPILDDVRKRGDRALLEYARRFDRFDGRSVRVSAKQLEDAASRLSPEFRDAVEIASANIRAFATLQMPPSQIREIAPGL